MNERETIINGEQSAVSLRQSLSNDNNQRATITFKVVYADSKPSEYGSIDDPAPWIRLADSSEAGLQNPNDIVIEQDMIKVLFDYPLEESHVLLLPAPNGQHFTRQDLATVIANKYQEIYREEAETTTQPVETIAERSRRLGLEESYLVNRARTDGRWGIWGHSLSDLLLSNIDYCPEKDYWVLCINS